MIGRTCVALLWALIPGLASACEYTTPHFDMCAQDTPWADGVWENGGDSATLHLGAFAYATYEEFVGHEKRRSLGGALRHLVRHIADHNRVTHHQSDSFSTHDLTVVRSIDTITSKYTGTTMAVIMLAEGGGKRVELTLHAPPETPVATVEALSRTFAGLIRPTSRRTD